MPPAAQSGIPSAVGMCIESTWRTAPITVASGNANVIGVSASNPHRFRIVDPGGGIVGSPEVIAPSDEIDGDVQLQRTILASKAYQGGFSMKCDGENLYDILLGILGRDVQTQVAGAGSTMITPCYKHVFTPNKYAPSFTVEEIFGDANYGRVTTGYVLNNVELAFGRILTARFSGVGYRQIPNTYPNGSSVDTDYDFTSSEVLIPTQMGGNDTKTWSRTAAPTYIDVAQLNNGNGPFIYASMGFGTKSGFSSAFMTIDDSAQAGIKPLEGWTLGIGRDVQSYQVGGAGYDPGACVGNMINVGGDMKLLFQDNSIPKAALKHSKIGLNFLFSGIYIGSSAQKYSLEVHLPNVKFQETSIDVPASAIMTGGRYVARKDPSLGYAVQLTLINTFTNASLGGGAGTTGLAGGLGGWSNA